MQKIEVSSVRQRPEIMDLIPSGTSAILDLCCANVNVETADPGVKSHCFDCIIFI